jgi:hypothetical protein
MDHTMQDLAQECRSLVLGLPATAVSLKARFEDGFWQRPVLTDWEASKVMHTLTGSEEVRKYPLTFHISVFH